MKRKELEMRLQKIPPIKEPRADLEQYNTPAKLAADILFSAHMEGHILNKTVADFGTGSGILAIGASLLGAWKVSAVDLDERMIAQAKQNAKDFGIEDIEFIRSEITDISKKFDIVIQNPPFGAQKPHADIPFLKTAMECGEIIYSIHKLSTIDFLRTEIPKLGGMILSESPANFPIPHTFHFHEKELAYVDVIILKISKTF